MLYALVIGFALIAATVVLLISLFPKSPRRTG